MKVIMVLFSLVLLSSFSVVYAQEMGLYTNQKYDFSFEAPSDWRLQEIVELNAENTEEVILFPQEFSLENLDEGEVTILDKIISVMGLEFQFESPLIGVDYRNIPTSEIPTLNEQNIKEYYLDETMELDPGTRIAASYSKTHSYGWEVGIISISDLDVGFDAPITYKQEEKLFVFKDRAVYSVAYGSSIVYFDTYKPVYDHVINTMTIKSYVFGQTSEEIESEILSIFDDIDETVSDVESIEIAGKNVDQMTDKELIDRLEKLLNTDVDLTMQDAMDKIKDGEMTDALAEELEQRMSELWSESKGLVEESREIAKELRKRGYDVEAIVLTTHDSMSPIIKISKPIFTNDVMPPSMQAKQGVASSDVICKDGLELIFKSSDGSSACVKPETAEKLIQRGWAIS